jgi:threonine dehydrogenase-like Zn-dependent dehydrogenase
MIGWNNFSGGSWSPYFVAHASQLYRVPDGVSDERAVLTDPVAGALHGMLRRPPKDGESVLILGGGVLGMAVAACLNALGYRQRIVGLVRHTKQAEHLKRYGVCECAVSPSSEGQAERYGKVAQVIGGRLLPTRFGHQAFIGGFDLVYDCVGSGQSLTDALKFARSGGTVALVGTSQISIVDTAPIWFDEVSVVGANGRAIEDYRGRRCHTYEIVFDLFEQGKLDLDGWLTHVFGLDEYRKALAAVYDRGRSGAVKVALDPWKV